MAMAAGSKNPGEGKTGAPPYAASTAAYGRRKATMREIVYVAGETSGDRHAAALHSRMLEALPPGEGELRAWGYGGKLMRDAGIELLADSSHWGAIGVVEALVGVPIYTSAMLKLRRALLRNPPDALILIDFGYFNVLLARWAKAHGIGPIIYYMPPGSWKRARPVRPSKRSLELVRLCDLIITPFRWNEEHLAAAGANVKWVGHPLRDIAAPSYSEEEFNTEYGIEPSRAIVALLPGSRKPEISHNLPMMLHAASLISHRVPGTQFLLAAAPNLRADEIERMLSLMREEQNNTTGVQTRFNIIESAGGKLRDLASHALSATAPSHSLITNEGFLLNSKAKDATSSDSAPWRQVPASDASQAPTLALVKNLTYDCLARADLAIICSGTATLEAAILERPMIIVYRGSVLMEVEYHLRKNRLNIEFIGLPNIVAGHQVAPELLQHDANSEAVSELAVDMLLEPERLMRSKKLLDEFIKVEVGEPGVIRRAAALIWECIEGNTSHAAA